MEGKLEFWFCACGDLQPALLAQGIDQTRKLTHYFGGFRFSRYRTVGIYSSDEEVGVGFHSSFYAHMLKTKLLYGNEAYC